MYKSKYKKVGVVFMFLSDELPTLGTLDFTIRIGSTPNISYFDLYLNTAYAARYFISLIHRSLFQAIKFRKPEISGYKQANSLKHPMSRFKQKLHTPRKKDEGLL